jgi:signal transduction histidine kinase
METPLEALVRLARYATEPDAREAVLPALAEAARTQLGADAAMVVVIDGERARVAATDGCPTDAQDCSFDADAIGPELEHAILEHCRKAGLGLSDARSATLVSGGALFGSLVVLHSDSKAAAAANLKLLSALADLGATQLASAARFEALKRANADLRASREILARSEKLRALGQMAAGVSHDLKNILHPLGLYLQLAERQLRKQSTDELAESLHEMREILDRGLQNLERLREFSRQSPESRAERTELDKLAAEALALAKPRMSQPGRQSCKLELDLHAPPAVMARSGELLSAVVNLIVNAIDAATTSVTIIVRTGCERDESWIEVEDDGPGMPAEVRERVFEPFFSTKGEEGTGLGLAMVYACAVRHGGRVTLDSELGKGARFRLCFRSLEG